jgi:hypothetical protein
MSSDKNISPPTFQALIKSLENINQTSTEEEIQNVLRSYLNNYYPDKVFDENKITSFVNLVVSKQKFFDRVGINKKLFNTFIVDELFPAITNSSIGGNKKKRRKEEKTKQNKKSFRRRRQNNKTQKK